MNILITSAGREVPLVKAFKKALRHYGGKIICADINSLSAAFLYGDISFLVPKYSDDLFIPKLLKICKKHNVKLIVPTKDDELPIFAQNRKKFEDIGTIVMVSNSKAIDICFDKLKFVGFCKKNNIPVPKTYAIEEIKKNKVSFPLFINDRFGRGSRSAHKVNNKEELKLYLRIIRNPIIHEYISSKEYTIDLFADFQGNIISVVPRERIFISGGESFIGKTCKNKKLIESAVDLSKKLKLIGHNNIQCFFNGKELKFIEVNPRYGGGSNLSFAAGANTPLYLIQIINGKKVGNKMWKFRDNFLMLRHTEDIFLKEKDIKCQRI